MQYIEGSSGSRAHGLVMKTLAVVMGGVVLVSAFVLSLVFFAIAAVVIMVGGGYLWWKTRELRKQVRAQMSENNARRSHGAPFAGNVIDGVVVSRRQSPPDNQGP